MRIGKDAIVLAHIKTPDRETLAVARGENSDSPIRMQFFSRCKAKDFKVIT